MSQALADAADTLMADPELRKYLQAEGELDAMEQRIFDLSKRVEALRPKQPSLKVRHAVKVGIAMSKFASSKWGTP